MANTSNESGNLVDEFEESFQVKTNPLNDVHRYISKWTKIKMKLLLRPF